MRVRRLPPALDLDAIPLAEHEVAVRRAIAAAKANPFWPFGAVIIGAADRAVPQGVNNGKAIPILHEEIVAINDYVARHGNRDWADGIGSEYWGVGAIALGRGDGRLTGARRQKLSAVGLRHFGIGEWFRRAACLLGDNYGEQGQLYTQPEYECQDGRRKQRAEQAAFQFRRLALLPRSRNSVFENSGKIRHDTSFRVVWLRSCKI
ncbi:MAG: hypothetical protein WCA23_21600 [Stellaceae bacterium]